MLCRFAPGNKRGLLEKYEASQSGRLVRLSVTFFCEDDATNIDYGLGEAISGLGLDDRHVSDILFCI